MSSGPDYGELARALGEGRYEHVAGQARELLASGQREAEVYELLAHALRRQGQAEAALAICDELLSRFPTRASAWREAGRTLNNLGRLARASEALSKACDLGPEDAGIRHDLAHVQQRLGDLDGARTGFDRAAQLRPDWAAPLLRLGSLEIMQGDFAAAEKILLRATQLDDSNADAWTTLGVARHKLGKHAKASAAYRRALECQPGHAEAWGNLGISLHDEGKLDEAVEAYHQALTLNPKDTRAATHLADAFLEAGNCEQALAVAEDLLAWFAGHGGALASKAIALNRLGRTTDYAQLVDLDALVLAIDIEAPPAFAGLDKFNDALSAHVLEHESLRYEPSGHATRHGHHTANLLQYAKGPVAELERAVDNAVASYRKLLARFPDHPVCAAAPRDWRLALWSVVMGSQGHQLPHIHPSAWLSGVYYARIPRGVSSDDQAQAGWIEFGRPPQHLAGAARFPVRRLVPREGRMFLFPAFFYHQTIPLQSDEPRISLAFDVAPVSPAGANIG